MLKLLQIFQLIYSFENSRRIQAPEDEYANKFESLITFSRQEKPANSIAHADYEY